MIFYGYTNCSDKKYNEIYHNKNKQVLRADQKYHSLLIKGLSAHQQVLCLSPLPINRSISKKFFIHEKDETENRAKFHYYFTINLPGLRQIMTFFAGFFNVLMKAKRGTALICDYQNISNACGLLLASKIRRIKSAVIVMDLPAFLTNNTLVQKIYSYTFHLADSFIFLTEPMNRKVNVNNKSYIVVEGIADVSRICIMDNERYSNTIGKKVVIYAGSLKKIYGIQNLTEGFIKAVIPDSELWIYGDGDYREELEAICEQNPSVIYKGVRSNEEVVSAERKAALLVNPRPSSPEYTKYSFPSKTMEYMASGTPLLTTRLPGIPAEYNNHLYFIEPAEENADGIARRLNSILKLPEAERQSKGGQAQEFVVKNKSYPVQARRIIDFFQREML